MNFKELYSGLYETSKRFYVANDQELATQRWNKYCLKRSAFPLTRITGKPETCLLVYSSCESIKSTDGSYKSGEHLASQRTSSSAEDELDLTGCPLECSINLNESVFQINSSIGSPRLIIPGEKTDVSRTLNMDDASTAHTVFSKISQNLISDFIVILCDGADREGTYFIGLRKQESTSESFRVTCKVYQIDKIPPFEALKRKHLMEFSANHPIKTSGSAKYIILSNINSSPFEISKLRTTIQLECQWKNVHQLLEVPTDATCTMYYDIHFGETRSGALSIWNELMVLKKVINRIDTMNVTRTEQDEHLALSMINILLEDLKWSSEKKSAATSQTKDDVLTLKMRKNLDFTDSVWNALKECDSQDVLCSCFNKIFEALQTDDLKVLIPSRNNTRLAKIAVNIRKKGSEVPTISGGLAGKLLVEAGIEKLKQDYINIFLTSGLVTKDIIKPFIDLKEPTDWMNQYNNLVKLHCVMELILMCQKFVSTSEILLSSYARTAFNKLMSAPPLVDSYKFSLPIDFKSSYKFLQTSATDSWSVRMDSTQDNYSKSTICHLSKNNPCLLNLKNGTYSGQFVFVVIFKG